MTPPLLYGENAFCFSTNLIPVTNTLGGYIYQASTAPSTYTLLTNPTTHYAGETNSASVITNNPNTWVPYSSNIPKSIYDPCPYGYRVPKDGSWTGFPANTWTLYAITGGTSWNSSWWPATGYRWQTLVGLYGIGYIGHYRSSSPSSSTAHYACYLAFDYNGRSLPNHNEHRSISFSVRCIEGIGECKV